MTEKKYTTAQRLIKLEKDYKVFEKVLNLIYGRQEVMMEQLKELRGPEVKKEGVKDNELSI